MYCEAAEGIVKVFSYTVGRETYQSVQDHPGKLSFTTDCWTSPNHRAFAAFTVHLEQKDVPLSFLLDFLEIPESHTGETLVREFDDMLRNFRIQVKVCSVSSSISIGIT